jgi:hypothetical protein
MNIGVIAASPAAVYCDLSVVEIALERLLSTCWDYPSDAPNLNAWREFYQGAEFTAADEAFVLDCDTTSTVRATLRRAGREDTDWMLTFRRDRLVKVEGAAGVDALADAAWMHHRIVAEGTGSANTLERPPEQPPEQREATR